MTLRTQKILISTAIILFTFAMGYILYITFFKTTTKISTTSPSITDTTKGQLPGTIDAGDRTQDQILDTTIPTSPTTIQPKEDQPTPTAQGGITKTTQLTLTGVTQPTLAKDGQSLNYYNQSDGNFYAVDKQGKQVKLLNKSYPNVDEITWSDNAQNAILEFPDGANIILDFTTGDTHTLPTHWSDFDFAPHGQQIAAKSIGTDPGNRWLIASDLNGSNVQLIEALGNNANKVQVDWSPNNQVIAFSDTGATISGFGRKQILPIGMNKENFPGLIVEGFEFTPLWSQDGSQLLYSTSGPSSNYQPQLWFTDATADTMGNNRKSIPVNTWADKCTYADKTTVYCAVPNNLPQGSGLQRDLAFTEPDTVYKINTKTGLTSIIGSPEDPTNMKNLIVSDDGKTLFYQDTLRGTVSQIQL